MTPVQPDGLKPSGRLVEPVERSQNAHSSLVAAAGQLRPPAGVLLLDAAGTLGRGVGSGVDRPTSLPCGVLFAHELHDTHTIYIYI